MYNLRKDYFFKIITNIFRIPISFLLQSIFPRILGPIQYGNFEFLNDSFTRILTFLESGNTLAFYTRLSSNKSDYKLIKFYKIIVLLTILIIFLILFIICYFNFNIYLWPNQTITTLILVTILVILVYISNILIRILDSFLLTISIEKLKVIHIAITFLIFVFFYFWTNSININYFILIQICLQIFLILGSIYIINNNYNSVVFIKETLTSLNIKFYIQYFYKYSSPLFIFSVFALIFGFGDRWLLQKFGGSIQQAYFSLAQKTGAFIFIFTSAVIPLYIRENSKHFYNSDHFKMAESYIKNIKLFMFLTIFLSTIISFNSKYILLLIGGDSFSDANNLFILMSFYPIHQTLGQLNGVLYYSTNRTKIFTKVGLFSLPLGFLFSFILIAPYKYYGFNLGSIGLAIQMLIIQFVNQNILLFKNCQYLKISFLNLFLNQLSTIIIFLTFGFVSIYLLQFINISNKFIFLCFFSIFLFLFSIIVLLINPKLIGLNNIFNLLNNKS